MFKRKFEEEAAAPAAEAAPAADPKESLIAALTAMGLNAEQAEAVYAMANDLIAAGTGEGEAAAEPAAVEASRQRRGRKMGNRRKKRMSSRGRRSMYSSERRAVRGRRVRGRRAELAASRRGRRAELSAEQRTIARQRRVIAAMKRDLAAQNNAPAARKLSSNPLKGGSAAPQPTLTGLSAKERVMNFVKEMI